MNELDGYGPTKTDVQLQLHKLLESQCFVNKPVRAMLLQYLVEMALAKKPVNERSIGKALFPGYKEDDDDVRINSRNLRDTLSAYYLSEGVNDLVRIDLPKGPGYRPEFSYMPNAEVVTLYRYGLHHASMLNEQHVGYGMRRLQQAAEIKPDFAPAYAAHAQALLRYQLLYNVVREIPFPLPDGATVESLANQALALDPKQWRAHLALAGFHCCKWHWARAKECFDAAIKLRHDAVTTHSWYAGFLLATGQTDEAVRIVEAVARLNPADFMAQLVCALFLYVARRYEQAEWVLRSAQFLDREHWAPHFVRGLIELASDAPASGGMSFRLASTWIRFRHEIFFSGFTMLCDLKEGDISQAQVSYSLMKDEEDDPRPLNLAMAYMAMGKPDKAIAKLQKACAAHDPVMVWLHLWPILDPLRDHPKFCELIARMRLPHLERPAS
jgi:tetratricopeptide (TPR) repeat protein